MSYNKSNPPYLTTAGKVTILTSVMSMMAFMLIFLLNIGQSEFQSAIAQTDYATTSVNVLNTPPDWTVDAQESPESSALFPTNSGDVVSFTAVGTDSNLAPYFLIICTTNATPTAVANAGTPGTAQPICDGGSGNQIAVSTSTASGLEATAATTTLESFAETNAWYAWICDDDAVLPRCNDQFRQGSGTTSSPFIVNHRPTFTTFSNDSPTLPGDTLNFTTVASDIDVAGTADTMKLIICNSAGFDTATDTCTGTLISSSTFSAPNPSVAYPIAVPFQDQLYPAYPYLIDEHGHEASGGAYGVDVQFEVANALPTVDSSLISINGGSDIIPAVAAGETTGFTLSFVALDDNSCENAATDPEIVDYAVSLYRSGVGSTTCDASGSGYNPNNCYSSGVASTTWNISCVATTTGSGACGGVTDTSVLWECTYPLWYVVDPTDPLNIVTQFPGEDWRAAVTAIDDNASTSVHTVSDSGVDVDPLLAFDLNTNAIPYGDLAPGDDTVNLNASTTASSTGNIGLDTSLSGVRMCPNSLGFPIGTCPVTSTSSIAVNLQEYATSTLPYGTGIPLTESSVALDLNILKPTSTSSQPARQTYWGIGIPGTLSLSGVYTGQNTIIAVQSSSTQW